MNAKEYINTKYQPLRLSKKNNAFIYDTENGTYVLKDKIKINYQDLYNYLYSRGFTYVPNLIEFQNNFVILEYQNDIVVDKYLKSTDLIKIIGLLHNKTSYYKEITSDTYKEIYNNLKDKINYIANYYNNLFDNFILEEYIIPSHYLFLRNYTLIANATNYCKAKLDEWYSEVESKNKMRVCLVHNNLKLEHLLKNTDEYLISWDNYTIDSPVLDLYNFYTNEWINISFENLLDIYDEYVKLESAELLLLYIVISIPYVVKFNETELKNCANVRRLINYLNKSDKVISKAKEA